MPASAPYSPGDFQRLIVQEDDEVCTALNNLTQLSVMWWQMIRFKYRPDGRGFTEEYIEWLNLALESCPDPAEPFDGITPNPQDFKNLLLSSTSIFCEKFVKLVSQLSTLIYDYIAFEYNSTGTDFSDEYKAMLCGVDCGDPEVIDVNSILNYHGFEFWDVVQGEVDLIGIDPYDPVTNSTGMYVDMHGTTGRVRSNGEDSSADVRFGAMRTKNLIPIIAGKSYTIKYKLAGQFIDDDPSFTAGATRVRLLKEDLTLFEAVTADHAASDWDMEFTEQTVSFTAASTANCYLQIESIQGIAATSHPANNNVGPKIDDVIVTNTTDAQVLFSDDFEFEVDGARPDGSQPTPDPDDSKAVIPLAEYELCKKMAKILLEFPRNVYDVISFEFNAAGSGFSNDLKFIICHPLDTTPTAEENGLLNGLLAYWKHDEASGNVLDSHAAHDLTEDGGTLSSETPGKLVNSRGYPGSVVVRGSDGIWNQLTGMTGLSLSCWVKFNSLPTAGNSIDLISKGPAAASWTTIQLALTNLAGVYSISAYANPASKTGVTFTPVVGQWYYIAASIEGGNITISIGDGTSVVHTSGTYSGSLVDVGSEDFMLGGSEQTKLGPAYLERFLDGELDEVAMWNRGLSQAHVELLFNSGNGLPYSDFTV
jgi:hypothetical protein